MIVLIVLIGGKLECAIRAEADDVLDKIIYRICKSLVVMSRNNYLLADHFDLVIVIFECFKNRQRLFSVCLAEKDLEFTGLVVAEKEVLFKLDRGGNFRHRIFKLE